MRRVCAGILLLAANPDAEARLAADLTEQESAWIAAHGPVRYAIDPAWVPFSFVDDAGRHRGIDAEYLEILAAKMGLTLEFVPTKSWEESYDLLLKGAVDFIPAVAKTRSREEEVLFSNPYISYPVAILMRSDAQFFVSLGDLTGRRMAMPRQYVTTEMIQKKHPGIDLLLTDTTEQALRLVSQGRADATMENLVVASYTIRGHGFTNLKIAGLTEDRFDLHYAIRKDLPGLTAILNKGLANFSADERYHVQKRWLTVDMARAVDWLAVIRVIAVLAVFAAALLAVILFWNRRLAAELKERLRVEANLREAHAKLEILNEEKSMFLNMAAHDLNGPLTGIAMGCGMLETQGVAEVDRDVLDQVVDNLVSNALKFSSNGGSVLLCLGDDCDKIQVRVKDDGPGVKSEEMPKLFESFVRLSAQPTGQESSSGLGLAIVKRLVDKLGGKVWCESRAGEGATFVVEIPTSGMGH